MRGETGAHRPALRVHASRVEAVQEEAISRILWHVTEYVNSPAACVWRRNNIQSTNAAYAQVRKADTNEENQTKEKHKTTDRYQNLTEKGIRRWGRCAATRTRAGGPTLAALGLGKPQIMTVMARRRSQYLGQDETSPPRPPGAFVPTVRVVVATIARHIAALLSPRH